VFGIAPKNQTEQSNFALAAKNYDEGKSSNRTIITTNIFTVSAICAGQTFVTGSESWI
jgi:hypothetical protein